MKRINWSGFFENSSTLDELSDFAHGNHSFREFSRFCSWNEKLVPEIRKLAKLTVDEARRKAMSAYKRNGYTRI